MDEQEGTEEAERSAVLRKCGRAVAGGMVCLVELDTPYDSPYTKLLACVLSMVPGTELEAGSFGYEWRP